MKKLLLSAALFSFMASASAQVIFSVESPPAIQGSYDMTFAPSGNDWTQMVDLMDPNNAVIQEMVRAGDATAADSLGCASLITPLGGLVTGLNLSNAGSAYVIGNDIATSTNGSGSGLTVDITLLMNEGAALAVDLLTAGETYASANGVATTGGNGTGLTVDIVVDAAGEVTSIIINDGGADYEVGDVITIDGGDGNATFEITAVAVGSVMEVSVNQGGLGYASGDEITILAGDENAVFTVATTTGKVAMVYRGDCEFGLKALNAQNAGASAVVIVNNAPGGPIGMAAGTNGANVSIPVVMISDVDGALIRATMETEPVEVFIGNKTGFFANDVGSRPGSIVRAQAFGNFDLLTQDDQDFEVQMGGWVYNYGFNNQTNVTLSATIELDGNILYNESSNAVDITAADSNYFTLPTFSQNNYDVGYYKVTYTIASDSIDDYDFDNTVRSDFAVSDEYFSYSRLDENDLSLLSPGGLRSGSTYMESCIVFDSPNAERVGAYGLTFSAYARAGSELEDFGIEGTPVIVTVQQWNDNFVDLDDPNLGVGNINEIAFLEYVFGPYEDGDKVTAIFDEPVILNNNQRYLFCVNIDPFDDLFLGYDRAVDYEENISNAFRQPLFPIVSGDNVSTATFFIRGFGDDAVPAFGINLFDIAELSLQNEQKAINMKAYPSPADSYVTVDFQGHDVASIEVRNLTGQLVRSASVEKGQMQKTIDVNGLENGLYLFRVNLSNGLFTTLNVVVNH